MAKLRKHGFLNVRYSPDQLERLGIAACLVSRKRHVEVEEGPLSRDFTTKGVERLISEATPDELAQAEADLAERQRRAAARKEELRKNRARTERSNGDRRKQPRRASEIQSPISRTA